jgi:D-tyrosyl-tRNA(Tyr) deacylase
VSATTVQPERTPDTVIFISDPTQNGPESYGLPLPNATRSSRPKTRRRDGPLPVQLIGRDMIGLIQRVTHADVRVNGEVVGAIERGILALIGVRKGDDTAATDRLLERLLGYRIFPDAEGRMNLSLREIHAGGLLLVPQFTLAADTHKGTRAGFSTAAAPEAARELFDYLLERAKLSQVIVSSGIFGADMQVSLVNDGPVTFWLETSPTAP